MRKHYGQNSLRETGLSKEDTQLCWALVLSPARALPSSPGEGSNLCMVCRSPCKLCGETSANFHKPYIPNTTQIPGFPAFLVLVTFAFVSF